MLKKKNYRFKSFKKKSGVLIPFSLKKDIPFKVKRIFLIYGNKKFIRGNNNKLLDTKNRQEFTVVEKLNSQKRESKEAN